MQSFARSWVVTVGLACLLPSCSQNTGGLKYGPGNGTGGQQTATNGRITGSGGVTGAGGVGPASGGSGGGGLRVDAAVVGGSVGGSVGGPVPDAAAGSGGRTGGTTGSGGVSIGAGGVFGTGGAGGTSCPLMPPCNWCGGTTLYDSSGCYSGFRCANGANPCSVQPCSTSSPCPAGYSCGTDRLCWQGTGGAGGGTTGAGGRVGTGGTSGTTTACMTAPSCNWCGGEPFRDSSTGCVVGYLCANGMDACKTNPCTSDSSCASGHVCRNQLCWPSGTGGAGGGGGGRGSGGAGGTVGTAQPGVRCLRALCNTGQVCCVDAMSATLTCTSPADCAGIGGLAVACDGPEDCETGQHCCMSSGLPLHPSCGTSACLTGLTMCHSSADCAAGQSCCSASQLGFSYGLCTTGACPL